MTQPIANARLRPIIAPIFAPVIINAAITSVYAVIAPWIPVTVVPTSFATVAIDTFITELSSVIRNCADASVRRTSRARPARSAVAVVAAEAVTASFCDRARPLPSSRRDVFARCSRPRPLGEDGSATRWPRLPDLVGAGDGRGVTDPVGNGHRDALRALRRRVVVDVAGGRAADADVGVACAPVREDGLADLVGMAALRVPPGLWRGRVDLDGHG